MSLFFILLFMTWRQNCHVTLPPSIFSSFMPIGTHKICAIVSGTHKPIERRLWERKGNIYTKFPYLYVNPAINWIFTDHYDHKRPRIAGRLLTDLAWLCIKRCIPLKVLQIKLQKKELKNCVEYVLDNFYRIPLPLHLMVKRKGKFLLFSFFYWNFRFPYFCMHNT